MNILNQNSEQRFMSFYVWYVENTKPISMNKHGPMIGFAASTLAPLFLVDIVHCEYSMYAYVTFLETIERNLWDVL